MMRTGFTNPCDEGEIGAVAFKLQQVKVMINRGPTT